ncbi:MAG: InlB B-repeat-containing protein, partial [Coriobacteriia bacterium]|nr:InlB B-repeat-containing protein [Coriobacteriia bacterium]MCL2537146.1 InlB B-repeat-containing protein [Coriobacteriia bacterium]
MPTKTSLSVKAQQSPSSGKGGGYLYANQSVTIKNAEIDITGYNRGIYSGFADIVVGGDSKVAITTISPHPSEGFALEATDGGVYLSGGEVSITSAGTGIKAGVVSIENGTVSLESSEIEGEVISSGSFEMSDGKLSIRSNSDANNTGIKASDSIEIKGGVIDISVGWCGMLAIQKIVFSGGTTTIEVLGTNDDETAVLTMPNQLVDEGMYVRGWNGAAYTVVPERGLHVYGGELYYNPADGFAMRKIMISDTPIFYAVYDLTAQSGGNGTVTPLSGTFSAGDPVTITATPAAGFRFVNWTVVSGGAVLANPAAATTNFVMPASNVVVSAKFEAIMHTVSFHAQGGTAVPGRSVQQGRPVGTLPTPTRAGFTFAGWHTHATGGLVVSAATIVNGNVTYHARWVAVPVQAPAPAPAKSNNNRLSSLKLNRGKLTQRFSASRATHTVRLTRAQTQVRITPTRAHGKARAQVLIGKKWRNVTSHNVKVARGKTATVRFRVIAE